MASRGDEHFQFERSVDYFQCPICFEQLEEPMQCVNNEHPFCKRCITRHLRTNRENCPTCYDALTEATLRPARLVANLLSQQIISCEYVARGCRKKATREILKAHVRDCGFCPVQCSNDGCEMMMNRKDQAEHQGNECNFRKAKCEVCGQEDVPYVNRKLHCYLRIGAINEIKASWEYDMACVKGKLGKVEQDLAVQLKDLAVQMNAMKARLDKEISELKRDFSMSNNSTARAINEINTEIHNIRRLMYDMQRKQEITNTHISGIGLQMEQLSGQVEAISDRVANDTARSEIKKVRESNEQSHQDTQSEMSSLRTLLLRLNKNVNAKCDIVIAGGQNNEHELNSVEIFSWASRTWSSLNNRMSLARSAASSFVYEGQMVISGGVSQDASGCKGMECLRLSKLSTGQWRIFPSQLPQQYRRHKCLVHKNCLFIIGGRTSKTCDRVYKISLNVPNDHLELVCKMSEARQGHGAVLFGDSIIIVGGTNVSRTCLDNVLNYDIETQTFKTLAPLPIALSSMATVLWRDNIVIMGGRDSNNNERREVMMYNIMNEQCTMLPSMQHRRSGCTAVIDGHIIVVMGGRNAEGCLNTVEMFSFDSYRWQNLPPMNERRWYATAVGSVL